MRSLKRPASLAAVLGMALATAPGQTVKPALDARQVRQELETMKGILETTLRFAADEEVRRHGLWRRGPLDQEIQAYYLAGQGAVFLIPVNTSNRSMPGVELGALEAYVRAAQGEKVISEEVLANVENQVRDMLRAAGASAAASTYALWPEEPPPPPEAPAPPAPPVAPEPAVAPGAPPAPPAPEQPAVRGRRTVLVPAPRTELKAEESQKRLENLQRRLQEKKEEYEKRSQEIQASLSKMRDGLADALARYGDSLSILKPAESITLILTHESDNFVLRGPLRDTGSLDEPSATILSVKKSSVTDYKSGKISRDQFYQSILEYQQ